MLRKRAAGAEEDGDGGARMEDRGRIRDPVEGRVHILGLQTAVRGHGDRA